MLTPDAFVPSNAEITLITSLGVTGRNEKELTVMYLSLILFILGWFLYLLTTLLTGCGSFNDSDESGPLKNSRDKSHFYLLIVFNVF